MTYYYDNIKILPNEINTNIDEIILEKLKNKIGNKCNKYGYILEDSIIIKNKNKPKIISAHFDGSLFYRLEYEADIINPKKNSKLECKILKQNKHGILANNGILYIVIPYIIDGENKENELKYLSIGDNIEILIIESQFEKNDTQINLLGEFIKKID